MNPSQKVRIKVGITSAIGAGAAVLLHQVGEEYNLRQAVIPETPMSAQRSAIDAVAPPTRPQAFSITNQFVVPIQPVWTTATEKRFHALAVKDALDEISAEEKSELDAMNNLRRKHDAAIAPEQSFREFQQRKITRQLMGVLEKYVEFHRPSGNASRAQNA